MAYSRRQTPELNLKPEERIVLSSDFNLFYKPEEKPIDPSIAGFVKALDNFVNDAGTGMVISSEKRQKKEEGAKAIEDHAKLKLKFRDAVKQGEITEQANPYYIEKFKQLSLNEYATEFIDGVTKKYGELGVVDDITEGAFTKFYKKELADFIKKNKLDFFEATELEEGFFKETSAQRAILENNHRQAQLKLFKDKFDDKLNSRVYGIINSFKDIETSPLWNDQDDKYELLAEKLQKEITEYYNLTGDGRDAVDFIIKAKWPGIWIEEIERCLYKAGLNVEDQDNLIVTADIPAHDLILSADVVISVGSTTMLESAIAGLPVIVPSFAEAEKPDYQEFIQLLDTYMIYDIAYCERELEDLVRTRLIDPAIQESIMSQRIELFERYVTNMKGGAAERYASKILSVIDCEKLG